MEMESNIILGRQLRALRHSRGFTQKQLGKMIGRDQPCISWAERGFVWPGTLEKIARVLGVDVATLEPPARTSQHPPVRTSEPTRSHFHTIHPARAPRTPRLSIGV